MHHRCGWGGKLPRNSMRAPSGKNGSNGCFSVFTFHFSVHQVLTSHFPLLSSLDPYLIHSPNLQHFLRTSLIKAGGFKPGVGLGVQNHHRLTAKTPLFCSYPEGICTSNRTNRSNTFNNPCSIGIGKTADTCQLINVCAEAIAQLPEEF